MASGAHVPIRTKPTANTDFSPDTAAGSRTLETVTPNFLDVARCFIDVVSRGNLSAKVRVPVRVFSLKSCDTCRKALKDLAHLTPEVIDVRADGVSPQDQAAMIAAFGADVLNTRSTTWRNLSEAERALDPVELLAQHPTLMKRPVLEIEGVWYQGWTPATQAAVGV